MGAILDPCCGTRMMYFDKKDPRVVFGDIRKEVVSVADSGSKDGVRTLHIEPDTQMDFRALPFADESFRLIIFDPPHLRHAGPRSWLAAKYGRLGQDWREDLRGGFSECFRVLASGGTLIFKWSEVQIKASEILSLTPEKPLLAHQTGRRGMTHWIVFFKE